MMDCSEEVQSVSEEPTAQMELKKGMSVFIDVSTAKYFFNHYFYFTNDLDTSLLPQAEKRKTPTMLPSV